MNFLKLICLTIADLIKQLWFLPRSIALALKQKRQRVTMNEFEAERLDRLRNPSKYAGR